MKTLLLYLLLCSCSSTVIVKGVNQDGKEMIFAVTDAKTPDKRDSVLYFKPHWLFKQDTVQTGEKTDLYIKILKIYE